MLVNSPYRRSACPCGVLNGGGRLAFTARLSRAATLCLDEKHKRKSLFATDQRFLCCVSVDSLRRFMPRAFDL
jgi:hypothetical protein